VAAGDLDPQQLVSLGLGGTVLAFVFRTLWRQDTGWRSVLDAARADATAARTDAANAREDAAAARADAAAARSAESMCRVLIAELEARIREDMTALAEISRLLEARNDRHPEEDHPDAR